MVNPTISIIIPCAKITDYARESVTHCLALDYPDFEILVLPDDVPETELLGAIVIPTGKIGPAEKRDIGAERANGDILAFIDDDAYPCQSWLNEAIRHFDNSEVAAVGGPAITPPTDGLLRRAGGHAYSTFAGSASNRYRYIPQSLREVDDYPSCNFIVRKAAFKELGGFSTEFWPGEDTKFCLELTKNLKRKIIYDPNVLVYHHRRKLFIPHLKQAWSYAVHRGYFVKKFPQTSFRLGYFLPSLLLLGIITGAIASIFFPILVIPYLSVISLYVLLVVFSSLQSRELKAMPLVFLGIISMHMTYGLGFIKGLFTNNLVR